MKQYLVDTTEADRDPEFDVSLFVCAKTPKAAAKIWRAYFDGSVELGQSARVFEVPGMTKKSGAANWAAVSFVIIKGRIA